MKISKSFLLFSTMGGMSKYFAIRPFFRLSDFFMGGGGAKPCLWPRKKVDESEKAVKVGDRGVKLCLWPRKTAGGLRKWAEEARNHACGPERKQMSPGNQ